MELTMVFPSGEGIPLEVYSHPEDDLLEAGEAAPKTRSRT